MKSIFSSKTFWIAVVQALIGILVAIATVHPEIGVVVTLKSLLDIFLRIYTTQPVTV